MKDIELSIIYQDKHGERHELTKDKDIEELIRQGVRVEIVVGECSRRGGPAENTGGVQMFAVNDCVLGADGNRVWEDATQVRYVTGLFAYRVGACDDLTVALVGFRQERIPLCCSRPLEARK